MGTPFERIRARFLLLWLAAAVVLSAVPVAVLWPEWIEGSGGGDPLPDAVFGLLCSGLLIAVAALYADGAGVGLLESYRPPLRRAEVARLAALGLPMVGVALVGIYALYAPLSLVAPEFVEGWLFAEDMLVYAAGPPYPLVANVVSFVSVVLAAPIAEEWFFRGLLFRRWSFKWGFTAGAWASSTAFAVLHLDGVGSLVFGFVMCVLYARYRTLWAPTIAHAANNGIVWALVALDAHVTLPGAPSAADLPTAWWLPALGLVIALPWALRARRRYGPISSWIVAPPDVPRASRG